MTSQTLILAWPRFVQNLHQRIYNMLNSFWYFAEIQNSGTGGIFREISLRWKGHNIVKFYSCWTCERRTFGANRNPCSVAYIHATASHNQQNWGGRESTKGTRWYDRGSDIGVTQISSSMRKSPKKNLKKAIFLSSCEITSWLMTGVVAYDVIIMNIDVRYIVITFGGWTKIYI